MSESVVIIWDADGNYLRTWNRDHDEAIKFADKVGGTYEIAPSPAPVAEVKPLEWEGYWAAAPYGPYSIWEGFANEEGAWCVSWSGSIVAHAHSLEDAKSAAQADYERRIRSALSPQPTTVEQAARVMRDRLEELDNAVANAERSGPSAKGYVTDATFHHWCGERSALREALRALAGGKDHE